MKRCLSLLILFGLASSLLAQPTKLPAFRITGHVLNARDDSPIRRGHVTASLVAQGRNGLREPVRTDTDETGRFLLELPLAGNWQINLSAHNIRPQNFEEHEGYFSGVVLTTAAPTYDLVFHAIPDAVLTGTVTDEAGEPVRTAQVALFEVNKTASQTGGQPLQQKQGTQTDDRGRYEIASLEAGSYMVQVQAHPWYAGNLGPSRTNAAAAAVPPDPSLDVVYPTTWYPGGSDIAGAETLIAHAGESLQADVRLVPVPSAHLIIPSTAPPTGLQSAIPARTTGNGQVYDTPQVIRGNPNIALILPNGMTQPVFGQSFSRNPSGDVEIGGLVPGTYQLTVPGGPDSPPRTSSVQLSAGGAVTDLGTAQQTTAVTISVDGDSKVRASQIVLRSVLTGQVFPDFSRQDFSDRPQRPGEPSVDMQRGRPAPPQRAAQTNSRGRPGGQSSGPGGKTRGRSSSDVDEAILQIPPGQYEISLAGSSNVFLTGVASKGASVVGRVVTIFESAAQLTVHIGTGFATVQGIASIEGKPCVGALVLLVPATMGDPASLTVVHRDQSNTDGSFRMESVVPGPYILVAIDHGWSVRWTDPDTLRPYLMRGVPLDLRSAATVTPKLIAIAP